LQYFKGVVKLAQDYGISAKKSKQRIVNFTLFAPRRHAWFSVHYQL